MKNRGRLKYGTRNRFRKKIADFKQNLKLKFQVTVYETVKKTRIC